VTDSTPRIGVGVVGTGYFGAGLLRRISLLEGLEPRVAANRTLERAQAAYQRAGVARDRIVATNDVAEAQAAIDTGRYVATTNLLLPCALRGIDVIAEATGDLLVGASVALAAIEAGKHLVAANSDVQATLGPILKVFADRAGVVYTDIEGDEPGLLKTLFDYAIDMGLDVVVAGNGKGVLKRYATPTTQAAFATANGIQPWLATAAADGTKLNFELTVVANATGLAPAVRGMHGPTTDLPHLLADFQRLDLLDGGHYVDYVLGGRGVFVVVRSLDPEVQRDFRYLKLGDGPNYLLHRPEVLIHYAAPLSIKRAVKHGEPTVAPKGGPVAETIAFAKRDLPAGHQLDGVGGFDTYGLIARADDSLSAELLPIGIAQYARLRRPIRKDEPVGYDDVTFEVDNLALRLRSQQDAFFGSGATTT
jgi:predicted homoserine dehydrogenase-like protein